MAGASKLRARLASNPDDHEARFELATALFGSGERENAIDELLTLFKRDREWNEQAARKQLVKFFEAMGPTDPLTVERPAAALALRCFPEGDAGMSERVSATALPVNSADLSADRRAAAAAGPVAAQHLRAALSGDDPRCDWPASG